jgi:seryl-tRNA synthetase
MEIKKDEIENVIKNKCMSVKEAAELMGKSQQFIRVGLQRGILPFGTAVKMSSMWTYYISPKLFYEYTGQGKK